MPAIEAISRGHGPLLLRLEEPELNGITLSGTAYCCRHFRMTVSVH